MQNLIVTKSHEIYGDENLKSNQVIYYIDDNMVKFRTEIDGVVDTITIKSGEGTTPQEFKTQEKYITENGDVTPDEGYDGLSKVTVDVSTPEPVLEEITITENGVYYPNYDGYSKVTVDVPEVEKPDADWHTYDHPEYNVKSIPLNFTAIATGTTIKKNFSDPIYYTRDIDNPDWSEIGEDGITLDKGETVFVKARYTNLDYSDHTGIFDIDVSVICRGNIASMYFNETGATLEDYTNTRSIHLENAFAYTPILTAPLVDVKISTYGYALYGLFYGCSTLTTPPELPATELGDYCYAHMFNGCVNLTTAPELPATTLENRCYIYMFYNCSRLTTAPELPATTLADRCYGYMFYGCKRLTTAPSVLPATTLTINCYEYMFYNCSSLMSAPELPATEMIGYCYSHMFYNCTSLTTAPVLPATRLVDHCYDYMFNGCSSLNYIKAMFTTTPSTTYTGYWVSGVASTGTFVKNSAATWTTTGNSAVPSKWTVVKEAA